MVTIESFLNIEINSVTKKLLLDTINHLRSSEKEREEFTFNIYSIVIFPTKNEVLISDDVCPDENPATIVSMDEFYSKLKDFKIEE